MGRFQLAFSTDFENELTKHLLDLNERFYGLSTKDVRRIAFELAESLKLNHPFNKEKRHAGEDWLLNFMKRNNLSIRKPEPTSLARAIEFNRHQVGNFLTL